MQKWRRSPDTSVRGSRSFHAETKSKPACLHRHGAREKSGILNINTPTFLTPSQELVELNKLTEKKVGVTGHFENFFSKTAFSYSNTYKNTHAVWSTFRRWSAKKFEPRLPETVWTWFQQKNWDVYVQKSKRRSHLKCAHVCGRSCVYCLTWGWLRESFFVSVISFDLSFDLVSFSSEPCWCCCA